MVKQNCCIKVSKCGEIPGHLLALDLQLLTSNLWVVGLYTPPIQIKHCLFFKDMHRYFNDNVLLLGDFNSVTSPTDRMSRHLDATSMILNGVLTHWGLVEPPGNHLQCFSYHHPSVSSRKSQIDCIYMNKCLNNVRGYAVPTAFSGHYAVGIYLRRIGTKGPKPWRFPIDVLNDETKVEQIMHHLELFNDKDLIGLWEWIKSDVQDMAPIFSAYRQKQLCLEINSLHASLKRLNARIYRGENLDIDRERLENRLLTLKDHIWFDRSADHEDDWLCTEGTMSLDFLHLEDEKNYLFLEKLLVAGEVVTDDEKILNEVGDFYTELYSAKSDKSC